MNVFVMIHMVIMAQAITFMMEDLQLHMIMCSKSAFFIDSVQ